MAITKQLIYYLNAFPIVLQERMRDRERTTENCNFLQKKIVCDGRPLVADLFYTAVGLQSMNNYSTVRYLEYNTDTLSTVYIDKKRGRLPTE